MRLGLLKCSDVEELQRAYCHACVVPGRPLLFIAQWRHRFLIIDGSWLLARGSRGVLAGGRRAVLPANSSALIYATPARTGNAFNYGLC